MMDKSERGGTTGRRFNGPRLRITPLSGPVRPVNFGGCERSEAPVSASLVEGRFREDFHFKSGFTGHLAV